MSDLKPCPFCASPGSLVASSDHSGAWEGGCSSEGCLATDCVWDISEELAVAAWNRRASPPEAVRREALEEAATAVEKMMFPDSRLQCAALYLAAAIRAKKEAVKQ